MPVSAIRKSARAAKQIDERLSLLQRLKLKREGLLLDDSGDDTDVDSEDNKLADDRVGDTADVQDPYDDDANFSRQFMVALNFDEPACNEAGCGVSHGLMGVDHDVKDGRQFDDDAEPPESNCGPFEQCRYSTSCMLCR